LTVFGDGHVSLTDPAGSTANILPASPTWLRLRDTLVARATPERLRREFEEQDRFSDESRFIAHRTERYIRRLTRDWTKEILPGYLERGRLRREANDKVAWGRLGDNLGYLAVFEMEGLSGKGRVVRDLRNLDRALDKALDDLADTDALVLDIRLNGGGYDVVSQAIAARFIDNPKVTLRKTARRGSGSAPMAEHLSEPAERIGYRKPVYLLISGLTASAAEVLALMLKDLPHVTLIGEPTEGIFSDIMTVQLPNDWILGLSNEVYTDADATPYEGRGVPPDHAALLFDPQFHEAGRDAALERVFALHAERRSARAD